MIWISFSLKEEMKRKSSASITSQTGNTHSNIGIKVNKFAELMKNSSTVFVNDGTNEGERVEIRNNSITCGTNKKPITKMTLSTIPKIVRSTDGSISSSIGSNGDMTSPSEVLPSSGDEQL